MAGDARIHHGGDLGHWVLVGVALWAMSAAFAAGCVACADSPDVGDTADGGQTGSTTTNTRSTTTSSITGDAGAPFAGWSRLPGVSPACSAYVPDSPDVVAPFVWGACEDGTPGCHDLEINWQPPWGRGPFYANFSGAAVEPSAVVVIGRRLGAELDGWLEMAVSAVDGEVVSAVRGRSGSVEDGCAPVLASVGAGRVFSSLVDYTTGPSRIEYMLEVPLDTGVPRVFNTLTPEILHGNVTSERSAGPHFGAVVLQTGSILLAVPYDHTEPSVVAAFTVDNQLSPDRPIVVGPDMLYWAMHQSVAKAFVYHPATGVTEPYLEVPNYDIVALDTDGTAVVWVQSSPPYYVSSEPHTVELWSSAYSPNPSELAPTKIADLAPALCNRYLRLESGLVLLRSNMRVPPSTDMIWSRNIVLRLSDQVYWTLDAPEGMAWGPTLYVDEDEVAFPIQPPFDLPQTYTVRRQRLSALGPPTPLSGVLGVLSFRGG